MMPLGLSGSCQDRDTLFLDVFSFLIIVTGEGAADEENTERQKVQWKFSPQCCILVIVYGSC